MIILLISFTTYRDFVINAANVTFKEINRYKYTRDTLHYTIDAQY